MVNELVLDGSVEPFQVAIGLQVSGVIEEEDEDDADGEIQPDQIGYIDFLQ